MKHELWYSVVVRDRQGKVLSRERRQSRSFLKAWNQLLYVQMAQIDDVPIKDFGGTIRPCDPYNTHFKMIDDAGRIYYGVVVGTGNTPVAIDDYSLENPIAQGTGAGQMEYQICTVDDYVVAAPSCSFAVHRTIVNNSPAEITVREVGMKIIVGANYMALGIRDVLGTPQAVPIGGAITIDWTIQVTV